MSGFKTKMPTGDFLEDLCERIDNGYILPIIGPGVDSGLLPSRAILAERYADHVGYPFPSDRDNLAKVTQYSRSKASDRNAANRDFLRFIRRYLLEYAEAGLWSRCDEKLLAEVSEKLSISDIVSSPGGAEPLELREVDVYHLLAHLPFPIYLTTNYHDFMERALVAAGRERYRTHVVCGGGRPSIVTDTHRRRQDPHFVPTVLEPLVCHLHGIDQYPESLALSEDDYTRQLIEIASSIMRETKDRIIPLYLVDALHEFTILVLGYQFEDQDFKNISEGLLKGRHPHIIPFGLFQTEVHDEEAKRYIEHSLESLNCGVYFGTPSQLVYGLYLKWQEHSITGNNQETYD